MGDGQGWWWPANSRKAHYFVAGRSLCGKWGTLFASPDLTPDTGPGPDDCAACRRALAKREDVS